MLVYCGDHGFCGLAQFYFRRVEHSEVRIGGEVVLGGNELDIVDLRNVPAVGTGRPCRSPFSVRRASLTDIVQMAKPVPWLAATRGLC